MNGSEFADSDVAHNLPHKALTLQERRGESYAPHRPIKRFRLQRRHRFSNPTASDTESESDDERASEYGDGASCSDSASNSDFSWVGQSSSASSLSVNTSAKQRPASRLPNGSSLSLVGFLLRKGGILTLTLVSHSAEQISSLAQLHIDGGDLTDKVNIKLEQLLVSVGPSAECTARVRCTKVPFTSIEDKLLVDLEKH